ncbi:hypothetical protein ILUMI_18434 [Ignelater luminosus]|uniref:Uncharacterized protein n=1 Tax=Ignelater luminosus TaxID=2038154 RepID=A0A8K0CQ63_IGNLU|nr:hypothetical protein ILUMI_18434 [Ignelater luminosus]
MLMEGLLAQNFEVMQTVEDADFTIISNVLQLGQQSGTAMIVVGEDVYLPILLTVAAPVFSKIYLLKPAGKYVEYKLNPSGPYHSSSSEVGISKRRLRNYSCRNAEIHSAFYACALFAST